MSDPGALVEELVQVFDRIAAGQATEADLEVLRLAVTRGLRSVTASGEGAVAASAISDSVVITGDKVRYQNRIYQGPSAEAIKDAVRTVLQETADGGQATLDFSDVLSRFETTFGRPLDPEERQRVLEFARAVRYKRDAVERTALRVARVGAWPPLTNGEVRPYMGLSTFREADAALFYGRDKLVKELLEKLEQSNFVAVVGASGSGKSSAVLAGLVPRLRRGSLSGSEPWRIAVMEPGEHPLRSLATALGRVPGGSALGDLDDLERRLTLEPNTLLTSASMLCRGEQGCRLLLIVDQLEQLWTRALVDEDERRAYANEVQQPFVNALLLGLNEPGSPLKVVLTLRSDFQHFAEKYPLLVAAIDAHLLRVPSMKSDELKQAVQRPARDAGGDLESGLADELVNEVVGQDGALPLLEYTLEQLWEDRDRPGDWMTWRSYLRLGAVAGALAIQADAILREHYELPERQDELRHTLLRLILPGPETLDARRRMTLENLAPAGGTREDVQSLLQPLVAARLLTTARDEANGAETVEVTHDALIRTWPTLRGWIDDNREDRRFGLRVEEAATEWEAEGESEQYLWSGLRLANAEAWVERARPVLTAREDRFLRASREAALARVAAEEEARSERERLLAERASRLRVFVGVVLVLAILAVIGMLAAVRNADTAKRQADAGEALFEVAQANGDRALLLALAATYPVAPNYASSIARAAREALGESYVRLVLRGHSQGVRASAWSPDGNSVLTGSADGTAIIWDSATGSIQHVLKGHTGVVEAVAWSPGGDWALTGSDDGIARVWDSTTGATVQVLRGVSAAIWSVAWSPDGKRILTGSADGSATVWIAQTGEPVAHLTGHVNAISEAKWSPNGSKVLTASWDNTARVWNANDGTEELILPAHGRILAAEWSPNGKYIVLGVDDSTASSWDATSGRLRQTYEAHTESVLSVAWSPDGSRVVTGSEDGSARVWDALSGRVEHVLTGHSDQVIDARWSPDGEELITTSKDNSARIWDAITGVEKRVFAGHKDWVWTAKWSSDGKLVLTDSEDGTARIWSANGGDGVKELTGNVGDFMSLAWSPDGIRLLAGSHDGSAEVWNVVTGVKSWELGDHTLPADSIAWSPDGKWLLVGSRDGTVGIWDNASEDLVQQLSVEPFLVTSAAWSRDGEKILTGSDDGVAKIWARRDGSLLGAVQADGDPIISVEWSPSDLEVWTANRNGILRQWDWKSGNLLLETEPYEDELLDITWSPDVSKALAIASNGPALVWKTRGKSRANLFDNQQRRIQSANWSPNGRSVLLGGNDGVAQVWDSNNDDISQVIDGNSVSISSVAWSPEGKRAAIGSSDGTARIWTMDESLIIARLSERVCNITGDEEIRTKIPEWRGCEVELAAVADDLAEYKRLMGME